MITLSKSKILAFRQCQKRLWLEVHRPELCENSTATQARFLVGHQVGEKARQLYDPNLKGVVVDPQKEGFESIFGLTQTLLQSDRPIFEAGLRAEGVEVLVDVLLPVTENDSRAWRLVEVKSSTSVKDYHLDDVAVQSFVVRSSGIHLTGLALAYIDSDWTYLGDGDYTGLLRECDLTEVVLDRDDEVRIWIAEAKKIVTNRNDEPEIKIGKHCGEPYECGFLAYCQSLEPKVEQPIRWLPGKLRNDLLVHIEACGLTELRDVPDELLTDKQQRVKSVTLSGITFFDQMASKTELSFHNLPAYFLDFETVQFAVPIWEGTRPYQQIPFQFSVHIISDTGKLEQQPFLDLSGSDPSKAFSEALISACGKRGPIFVYNAGFEMARIRELSVRFNPRGVQGLADAAGAEVAQLHNLLARDAIGVKLGHG